MRIHSVETSSIALETSPPPQAEGPGMRRAFRHLAAFAVLLVAAWAMAALPAWAAAPGAPVLDGARLTLVWVIPFAGILLSIAIFPLVAPDFWHHYFGWISAFWAVSLVIPMLIFFGGATTLYEVLHTVLLEYIPFIVLLLSLFTITGGIRIRGQLAGTPIVNVAILAFGTAIASWVGTTGAAMLLIRPLLRANAHRKYRVHTVVFFIFLVANIGGSLTPLGDPPLFLGFLKGVPFFWPTVNMLVPMLFTSLILLVVYLGVDTLLMRRERSQAASNPGESPAVTADEGPLRLEGTHNLLYLGGVVAAVLMSGLWQPGIEFNIFHVPVGLQNILRDLLLVSMTLVSLRMTDAVSRRENGFSWFPIQEVSKLFAGIFLTIIPAIAILRAGPEGALSDLIALVSTESGEPVNASYFWLTGILSSFLDNAPTYLVFFNTAGGDPEVLTSTLNQTLLAISMGAVFMGANTYIGNAPNFMVRSIAQESGIAMPSFFGYMVWSIVFLLPLFVLVQLIFL